MDNLEEIMSLCRLCLVKDQVNKPIFDTEGDINLIYFKINSCLRINVSKDDELPKSICNGCWNKLDLLYAFQKVSVESEAKLQFWVEQTKTKDDKFIEEESVNFAEQEIKTEPVESYYIDSAYLNTLINKKESLDQEIFIEEEFNEPAPAKRARPTDAVAPVEENFVKIECDESTSVNSVQETDTIKRKVDNLTYDQGSDTSVSKAINYNHLPDYLPRISSGKRRRQKRCRICYSATRTEVSTYCPGCEGEPGLCIGLCFAKYHEKLNFKKL